LLKICGADCDPHEIAPDFRTDSAISLPKKCRIGTKTLRLGLEFLYFYKEVAQIKGSWVFFDFFNVQIFSHSSAGGSSI
jgi:hypothetical protein